MDVAAAIDAEAVTVSYRPVKTAGGSYVHGKWTPTAPVAVDIRAAIQPANGRQLMDLPEGVRTEARYFGWSRIVIQENDEIVYTGETFRVVFVWPRPADGFTRWAMGKK